MAFGIAILILFIGLALALHFSKGKTKKRKYIVWGITTMLVIAPLLSWLISISYGISVGDGFAAIGLLMLLFPLIFLVGIILLVVGAFSKKQAAPDMEA